MMHDRITVRMTPEMITRIDSWIAAQPAYVSRQEAVRRFVDMALEHTEQVSEQLRRTKGLSLPAAGMAGHKVRHGDVD